MKKKKLILIGGGGHCNSVIEVAKNSDYTIIGILDKSDRIGEFCCGFPIIGTDELISKHASSCQFIITVGQIKDSTLRKNLMNLVLSKGGELATIVSKAAYFSEFAKIGRGSIVMNHALVNSNVIIGENCIINSKSLIEHDTIIGNNTHISTGVIINGNCTIGNNCFIGSGSILSNNIQIPDNTIIGIGSIVNKSIEVPSMYFGNPLKRQIK